MHVGGRAAAGSAAAGTEQNRTAEKRAALPKQSERMDARILTSLMTAGAPATSDPERRTCLPPRGDEKKQAITGK